MPAALGCWSSSSVPWAARCRLEMNRSCPCSWPISKLLAWSSYAIADVCRQLISDPGMFVWNQFWSHTAVFIEGISGIETHSDAAELHVTGSHIRLSWLNGLARACKGAVFFHWQQWENFCLGKFPVWIRGDIRSLNSSGSASEVTPALSKNRNTATQLIWPIIHCHCLSYRSYFKYQMLSDSYSTPLQIFIKQIWIMNKSE